ncbi:MAG: GNAT family N-acetyltransferase [Christensenellales bacterium]
MLRKSGQSAARFWKPLPEWFGIPEAREEYIRERATGSFCRDDTEKTVGFLHLKRRGAAPVELYAMGVLKARHRTGVGRALVEAARRAAREAGYAFMQVKTVQMGKYAEYDATNRFYLAMGFKEFEVFPHLWDEWNPCQVYVMRLEQRKNEHGD